MENLKILSRRKIVNINDDDIKEHLCDIVDDLFIGNTDRFAIRTDRGNSCIITTFKFNRNCKLDIVQAQYEKVK